MWSGFEHNCRARVSWSDYCLPKQLNGLKLLDPEVSLTALLAKWILFAIEPGITNLKALLRHRILKMKPQSKGGYWYSSQAYGTKTIHDSRIKNLESHHCCLEEPSETRRPSSPTER